MKRILSSLAIVLGVAALVFAIALPTYVVPKGKVLPLNLVSTTGTNPTKGNLLDSHALANGKPVKGKENLPECKGDHPQISCFIQKDVEVQQQQFITAQQPSNDKIVTLESGSTVFRTDMKEPANLLSATVDRVTLDRKNQMPVPDPVSTVDLNAPALSKSGSGKDSKNEASVAPFTRPGITYQFPMGTDRKSYDYFDMQILKSQPIDFINEEELDGEKVYRFEQTVEPTDMYPALKARLEADGELSKADEGTLASLRLKFPAKVWGVDANDAAKSSDNKDGENKDADKKQGDADQGPEVEMSRYYTVHRTIWVQPDTGVIVNGAEDVLQYYAKDQADANRIFQHKDEEIKNPTRTAMYFPGAWNDQSRQDQKKLAQDAVKKMKLMGTTLPWILGVLGIILVAVGWVVHRKDRLARHAAA